MAQSTSRHFFLVIFLFDLSLLFGAILSGLNQPDILYHFEEGRLITFLSAFHLVAIAMLCWLIYERESAASESFSSSVKNGNVIWVLMAIGFLFLAFDETMSIHESIDFYLHHAFGILETGFSDRLDDVLILLYAIIGIILIYIYRRVLLVYLPVVKVPMLFGFALLLSTIILDVVTNRRDIIDDAIWYDLFSVLEEATKIIAEFLFFNATYRCWKYV